jgi:hypothetical protein
LKRLRLRKIISIWSIRSNDPMTNLPETHLGHGNPITPYNYSDVGNTIAGLSTSLNATASNIQVILRSGVTYWIVFSSAVLEGLALYYGIPSVSSAGTLLISDDDMSTWTDSNASPQDLSGMTLLADVFVTQGVQSITAPGMLNLVGDPYVTLRVKELESNVWRSRAFEKYHFGIATFKLSTVGFATTRFDYLSVPARRFHPLGSLKTMTFEFLRPNGIECYDFKGVNHYIIFVVRYLVPKMRGSFVDKILNPNYDPDRQPSGSGK